MQSIWYISCLFIVNNSYCFIMQLDSAMSLLLLICGEKMPHNLLFLLLAQQISLLFIDALDYSTLPFIISSKTSLLSQPSTSPSLDGACWSRQDTPVRSPSCIASAPLHHTAINHHYRAGPFHGQRAF